MTSLIATLLGTLPRQQKDVKALSGSQTAMANKSHARHLETIERVYKAIVAGKNTSSLIREATKLSHGAVINACQELEATKPTPRIKRSKTRPAHTFTAIK